MSDGKAKERAAPREVEPVTVSGVRYEAPHSGWIAEYDQNGGVVQAVDPASGQLLWHQKVYTVGYEKDIEDDKQDIYITALEPAGEGVLLVRTERGGRYRLDLATRSVTVERAPD